MWTYLFIPSLGIFINAEERSKGNGQDIIDRPDRAVLWKWRDLVVVADHVDQGFRSINRVVVGKTRAFLGNRLYICDVSEIGHIRISQAGNRLYRANWEPVADAWKDGLCIYTCSEMTAPDVRDVRLTHWRRLS